ncbi:MAG: hypothetical protein HQK53_03050 [Oligoflexia bacterium]|nr:hypothetical protein [Oligoflexia bacterium]
MRKLFIVLFFSFAFSFINSSAFSIPGICKLQVTRIACPGKQTESFRKCDGDESCVEIIELPSSQLCEQAAEEACFNSAHNEQITKSKSITATFNDDSLENGNDICDTRNTGNRFKFDKCD